MKELLTTVASRLEVRLKEQEEQLIQELDCNTRARAKGALLLALFHAQEAFRHLLSPAAAAPPPAGDPGTAAAAACTDATPPPNPSGSCTGGSSSSSDATLGQVSPQAQRALSCLDAQVAELADTLRLGAARSDLLAAGASAGIAALAVSTSSSRGGASASAGRAAASSGAPSAAAGVGSAAASAGPSNAGAAAGPGAPDSDITPGVVEGGAVGIAASDFARRIVVDSNSPDMPPTMGAFAAWWGDRIRELALLHHRWSTGAANAGQLAQHLSVMAVRLSALLLARPWGPAVFSTNLETCAPGDPLPAAYDRAARAMAPASAQRLVFQLLQSWWEAAAERLTAARRDAAQHALADPSDVLRQEAAVAALEAVQSAYLVHVSALCVVALTALTSPEQLAAVYLIAWPHMPSMVGLYDSVLRLYPPDAPPAPPAPQEESG